MSAPASADEPPETPSAPPGLDLERSLPPLPSLTLGAHLAAPERTAAHTESAPQPLPPPAAEDDEVYGREFWLAYAANAAVMIAVSVLFRYSDFVTFFGGSEWDLGLIIGLGNVGALSMRLGLGISIDRYGSRWVWLVSLVGVTTSLGLHLVLTDVHAPAVYLVRLLLATSLAGVFGASIVYVALLAPRQRMAEVIGVLGSSGFLGQAIGPTIADFVFGADPVEGTEVRNMFLLATAMGVAALLLVLCTTHGEAPPLRRHPPAWGVLRRYHPGWLLLVGVAMGVGIGLPQNFLRPYLQAHQIGAMQSFFIVYSITAFAVRVTARRLTEQYGVRRVVLWSLMLLAASTTCFLGIEWGPLAALVGGQRQWLLALPAVVGGVAHALLFPAVIAGGSAEFPDRYRGLGTTLMLSTFDLGTLIGPPLCGALVQGSLERGWPPYVVMFLAIAAGLLVVAGVFALGTRDEASAEQA